MNTARRSLAAFFAGLVVILNLISFCPAACAADEYNTAVERIGELQQLAQQYVEETGKESKSPLQLTMAYLRTGRYDDGLWILAAGAADPDFTDYVAQKDSQLQQLQGMGTITVTDTGEQVDFGHLLASINLTWQGLPIMGGWGGDCMELAKETGPGNGDVSALMQQQAQFFNIDEELDSCYSAQDLRADLDSVNIGAMLGEDGDLAESIRSYYSAVTPYSRAQQFIGNMFGQCDTGDTQAFRQTVLDAMLEDEGMQMLLMYQEMWDEENWAVKSEWLPALTAATNTLSDYLSAAVGGETVQGQKLQAGNTGDESWQPVGTEEPAQPTAAPAEEAGQNRKILRALLALVAAVAVLSFLGFLRLLFGTRK